MELIIYLLVLAGKMAFWGFVCWKVIDDKGYDADECRKYAILGAIFGLIVLIVAVFKEKRMSFDVDYEDTYVARYYNNGPKSTTRIHNNEPVRTGYWRCPKCGRDNANYAGSCGCGYDKYRGV